MSESKEKEGHKPEAAHGNPSRRDWLLRLGVALNVIAGAALAIPLVGFVFSSFAEKKDPRDWISLGPLEHFPEKTTRIATYRNPYTRPWDGETAEIPCWVRRIAGMAASRPAQMTTECSKASPKPAFRQGWPVVNRARRHHDGEALLRRLKP